MKEDEEDYTSSSPLLPLPALKTQVEALPVAAASSLELVTSLHFLQGGQLGHLGSLMGSKNGQYA